MATRCCWPPESSSGIVIGAVGQPDLAQHVSAGSIACLAFGDAQHVARRLDHVVQGGHVREQIERLEHHADLARTARPACGCSRGTPSTISR